MKKGWKGLRAWLWGTVAVLALVVAWFHLTNIPYNTGHGSVRVLNDMSRLRNAVEGFYQEYSRLPEAGASHLILEGPQAGELLMVLLGKEEESRTMENPMQLAFLDSKSGINKAKGGLVFSGSSVNALPEGFYDRWGEPVELFLRAPNASDLVFHDGKRLVRLPGAVAAVMSKGPDRKRGTGDDLKTWK